MFGGIALLASAASMLGCPPSDYGKRCRISGDDTTTCGQCIARACQAQLEACCEDTYGCRDRLVDVDACSTSQGCSKLYASIPTGTSVSSSSNIASIAKCVKSSCEASCPAAAGTGSTGSSGSALCQLLDIGCQCVTATKPSALPVQDQTSTCGPAQVSSSPGYEAVLCCAASSWPAGGSCRCIATTPGSRCGVGDVAVARCL